uniref:Uncharacterized protein n=1 Tax=Sphaerodactylus townsendi TaxID=933632 RepID=A0ACB8EL66_9SAUR
MRAGPGADPDRRQRWAALFEQLDANRDGRVDAHELRRGLARLGMHAASDAEQAAVKAVNMSVVFPRHG